MKCQILFSRKYKKNIMRMSSAQFAHSMISLTFTTLWANSADDKLVIFFLYSSENGV